jgi:hypothetical protein
VKAYKFIAVLAPLVIFAGCQATATSNSANGAAANSVTANSAGATTPTPGVPPIADNIEGSSPSDVYRTAHIARQKKDIETLKKIFAKDVLGFFTEVGKADKKSLDDMLREMCEEADPGQPEVRNEKITGETAMIEYKEDGSWRPMHFVREDGAWKMTIPKGDENKDKTDKDNK